MKELVGKVVTLERLTHIGTETIVGAITTPMMIEETSEGEEITHVTVEGMVVATKVRGLPLPIETEEPVRIELLPVSEVTVL